MKVLIVCEDFTKDQYVAKPVIEAMLSKAGRKRATVRVAQDPRLGGIHAALDLTQVRAIVDRYQAMVDVIVLLVDRDGDHHRQAALQNIEQQMQAHLGLSPCRFFAEHAWQEIETWALAGQKTLPWPWQEVRAESNSKERYFQVLVEGRGLADEPGGGRRTLGLEAAANYKRVRSLCPEDVEALELRFH